MATIDWPAGLIPQTAQLTLRKAGTQFASPFNGTLQAFDFVAERWVLSASLAPQAARNPQGVESFCNTLAGGIERVRVWPFHAGGTPRGTVRGSPTLSSAVSRGAVALPITGAAHSLSLVRFPEDLRNTAEAGATRPWSQFLDADAEVVLQTQALPGGGTGTVSRMQVTTTTPAQRQVQQPISVPDNVAVCASVYARADEVWGLIVFGASKTPAFPVARYRVQNGTFISAGSDAGESLLGHGIIDAGGGWWRVWWAWNTGAGPAQAAPIIGLVTSTGAPVAATVGHGLFLWGVQLEYGTTPTPYQGHPTLLQGDFIGVGGQLFMVAADTVLTNGVGSVPLINRVRGTIASGSPVTWYRPSCEMVLPAMQAGPVRRPGVIDSTALDLVEVW